MYKKVILILSANALLVSSQIKVCVRRIARFLFYNMDQFFGNIKCCDQSGDRVSENDKRYHIHKFFSYNAVLKKYDKYGTLSIYVFCHLKQQLI